MRATIVTRLRILAVIAPVVLLLTAPFVMRGFYTFGDAIANLREHTLRARDAAHGMELALYQIESSPNHPEADEILLDQTRQFAHWLDLAQDRSETDRQRRQVAEVAQTADPVLRQLRTSGLSLLRDPTFNGGLRELHAKINDLIAADDTTLIVDSEEAKLQANHLSIVAVITMLVVPWLTFIGQWRTCGRLNSSLRAARRQVEAAAAGAREELAALDTNLAELGYPKPDPRLAEADA